MGVGRTAHGKDQRHSYGTHRSHSARTAAALALFVHHKLDQLGNDVISCAIGGDTSSLVQ